jgi:hypothetical protein
VDTILLNLSTASSNDTSNYQLKWYDSLGHLSTEHFYVNNTWHHMEEFDVDGRMIESVGVPVDTLFIIDSITQESFYIPYESNSKKWNKSGK